MAFRSKRDWLANLVKAELMLRQQESIRGRRPYQKPAEDPTVPLPVPPPVDPTPPSNQAPNILDYTWRSGVLVDGKLPISTPIGTALMDLSAAPGTGISYSEVSDPDGLINIIGSTVYLSKTPAKASYTVQVRAANSLGGLNATITVPTDFTTTVPVSAHGKLAGPQFFVLGVYVPPPSEFQKWKDRGANTIVEVAQGVDYETHNTQAALLDMWMIRQPRTDPSIDLGQKGLLAWATTDEPSNITNGGGLDYPNVRETPTQVEAEAAPARAAATAAGDTVPVFTNHIGNHIWPAFGQASALMADYHQGSESDWLGADTYQINAGNPNLLTQTTNGASYCSTYQGHIIDVQRGWASSKPIMSIIETSPFDGAANHQVTPGQFRAQFWSSIIHGASMICLFPLRFSPTFAFDATPANVVSEIQTQFATVKSIESILIDTTNGGRRANTVFKSAAIATNPTGTQFPYPFEGCEITKSDGTKYYIVLNLSETDASFTYLPWGLQSVTIPAQSIKHGNAVEVQAPPGNPGTPVTNRGKIPIIEDATLIPGIPPSRNLRSPVGVSGITISNTWSCFVSDGNYSDIDFSGYRVVRTGSGEVNFTYCKFTQHTRWHNLSSIVMDWDQSSTVQPPLRAPVNGWTRFQFCLFDGLWTTDSVTNINKFVYLNKGPVDIWMCDVVNVNEQFAYLCAGRIQQNRGLKIGWLPGGHIEFISIMNTWAGYRVEISENYCDMYAPFINDGGGGVSGWIKHYNELDGIIQGETICENNYIFSGSSANLNRIPWYVLSVGTIDQANGGRAWFGFNKFSGYRNEDNVGGNYQYASSITVQGLSSQGNVNPLRSNRALPDLNIPTVPSASTVTFTGNTSNFQVASISLGANATEVELRYCISGGPRWSEWKKITVGDTFPGSNGIYDIEYRSVRRVGTTCARQVGKTSTTVTVGSVTPTAPAFVSGPTLSGPGSPTVGSIFTINYTASGNPAPTPSYRWLRDGTTPISGATSASYTAVSADDTHTVVGEVTLNNGVGSPAVDTTDPSATIATGGGGSVAIRATGAADTDWSAFGRDNTVVAAIPGTRISGDKLIAWLCPSRYDSGAPHVPPSGWTLSASHGNFGLFVLVSTKTSDGTETSYTFTYDMGVDDATLFARSTVIQNAINGFEGWTGREDWVPGSTTIAGENVTQSGNSIVFQMFGWDGAATIASDPAGWTKLFETKAANSGGDPTRAGNVAVYYKNQATSGVVTAPTITLTAAPSSSASVIAFAVS